MFLLLFLVLAALGEEGDVRATLKLQEIARGVGERGVRRKRRSVRERASDRTPSVRAFSASQQKTTSRRSVNGKEKEEYMGERKGEKEAYHCRYFRGLRSERGGRKEGSWKEGEWGRRT